VSGLEAALVGVMLPVWWGSLATRWLRVPFALLVLSLAYVSRSWEVVSLDRWGLWLAVGVAVGAVAFTASVALLGNPVAVVADSLRRLPDMFLAHARRPMAILYYLAVATSEEFIVRVTLQGAVLGGGAVAIAVTSLLFGAVHCRPGRGVLTLEMLDLLLFSCLMGVLFDVTHSLPLVVAAHAVRNLNAAYMRGTTLDTRRVADPGVHGQEA